VAHKKKDALEKRGTTALTNWQERMRQQAIDVAAREVLTAPRISIKGGSLTVNGQDVPLNKNRGRYELPVIITEFTNEKAYFDTPYVEGEARTPVCYAFHNDEKLLTPLKINGEKDNLPPKKQADSCAICPHNAMGTAEQGDGKACRDHRRLMVLAASVTAGQVPKSEALLLSVPPTSLKNWKKYLKGLRDLGFTPWGVRTLIFLYKEKGKAYYNIGFEPCGSDFEPVESIQDAMVTEDLYIAIEAKQPAIRDQMFAPYPVITGDDEKPKKAKGDKAKDKKRAAKVA
jgi:hypothetical protein